MKISDKLLYNNIKKGDEQAFNQVFNTYYLRLCLFSNKIVGDLDKSRSLVQEVFVNLWVDKNKLNINTSLKSYLYLAVKNTALDYLRHLNVESKYISTAVHDEYSNENIQDIMEQAELNNKIHTAIDKLPKQCQTVFKLSRIDGLKYVEISKKLNISIKTTEMHMSNALKKLRSELSELQVFLLSFFSKK